eukprot:2413900-Amphidinium_carterae.1
MIALPSYTLPDDEFIEELANRICNIEVRLTRALGGGGKSLTLELKWTIIHCLYMGFLSGLGNLCGWLV